MIVDSVIGNNSANNSRECFDDASVLVIEGSIVSNNAATSCEGAAHNQGGPMTIRNSTNCGNTVGNIAVFNLADGGAIYIESIGRQSGNSQILDTSMINNRAMPL